MENNIIIIIREKLTNEISEKIRNRKITTQEKLLNPFRTRNITQDAVNEHVQAITGTLSVVVNKITFDKASSYR